MCQPRDDALVQCLGIWLFLMLWGPVAALSQSLPSIRSMGNGKCSVVFVGADIFLTAAHCVRHIKPCSRTCSSESCQININGGLESFGNCSTQKDLAICQLCDDALAGPFERLEATALAIGDEIMFYRVIPEIKPFGAAVSVSGADCFYSSSAAIEGNHCMLRPGDSGSGAFRCSASNCERRVLVGIFSGRGHVPNCVRPEGTRHHCRVMGISAEVVRWVERWAQRHRTGPICGIDRMDAGLCRGG